MKNTLLRILAVGILTMGLMTCNNPSVGLGEKVDIYAPVVTVTSPAINAYVKGTIAVTGKVSDDFGVTKFELSYKAKDGSTVTKPVTVATDGTWTYNVVSGTGAVDELPDGNQSLTFTAEDASAKSAALTMIYNVDNIAPTVLITAPLTYGGVMVPQNSDYIDLKGEVYDASPVTKVTVTLYQPDGVTPLTNGVQDADGTNTWSTRYYLKDQLDIDGVTVKIPGIINNAGSDGFVYSYRVAVTDKAGNVSTYYYHRSDVFTLAVGANGLFPTMDELGKLDQAATGTGPISNIVYSDLAQKKLGVTVAPAPSPVYGDFKYLHIAKADIDFTNLSVGGTQATNILGLGAPVTGIVTPPAGFGGVQPETLQVRVYTNAGYPATPLYTYNYGDVNGNLKVTSLGSSVSFIASLKKGVLDTAPALDPGPYVMEVDAIAQGTAKKTQRVDFTIDAAYPALTETELGIGAQFKNAQIQLKGSASYSNALQSLLIDEYKDGTLVVTGTPVSGINGNTGVSWTSPLLPTTFVDGVYDFKLTLMTQSGKTVAVYRSVTIDATPPSAEVTRFDPVVGTASVNGVVNVGLAASDANGVSGVRYIVQPAATAAPANFDALTPANNWTPPYTMQLDTIPLTDNTDYKLWIIVKDKSGNETKISKDFRVDQSTDAPVIGFSNINTSATTSGQAGLNLMETSPKILGNLNDDDKVDRNQVEIQIDAGAWIPVSNPPASDAKVTSFTHDMAALSEGVHSFRIRVGDLASEKLTKPTAVTTSPLYYFAIDKNAPTLTVTTAANSFRNANFTITGTAADSGSVQKVEYSTDADFSVPGNIVDITGVPATAWSKPITLASMGADGAKTVYFRVTDGFNKTAIVPWTFNKDTAAPTGAITTPNADGSIISSSSFNFGGTAADGTGAGVSKVQYSLNYTNDANDANDTWQDGVGTGTWTVSIANMATAFGTEGNKLIGFRFVDTLGNTSTSAARTFVYDTAIPTLTVTGGLNRDVNAGFTLSGTAADGNGIQSIAITQKKGAGGSVVPVTVNGPTGTTAWSLANLPRNEASIGTQLVADGTYYYNVTATDLAGRTSLVASVTIRVDQSPPNLVSVTAPGAGQTGLNSLFGSGFTFRGTASDAGVGVAKVYYLINSSATAPAGTAGYSSITTTGNWDFYDDLDTDGVGADSGRAEGTYYIHVKAEDNSGNVTPDGSVVSVAFGVDQSAPSLAETAIGTTVTQTKGTAFTLSGTASDTNASGPLTVSATRSLDGGAASAVTVTGTTSWTINQTPTTDGTYVYTVTATDAAGKTTSVNRTIRWDTTGPALTLVNPTAGAVSNSTSLSVTGVASDPSGLKSLYYALGAGEPSLPADVTADGNWTSAGWTAIAGASDWTINLTGLSEGAKTIWIRSIDLVNNVSSAQSRSFYVDSALPNLTETAINVDTMVNRNGAYTLSGTASDTNALSTVTATVSKDGAAATNLVVAGTASWSINENPSVDGVYTYVITATDAVGKTRQVTRIVKVDKTAPSPTLTAPTASGWLSTSTLNLAGVASDGLGTGVKSVYYYLGASELALPGTITADANWTAAGWSIASGSSDFNATVTGLIEGSKTLWIRVIDQAGNLSSALSRNFGVDLSNPTVGETGVGAGAGFKNAAFSLLGTSADANGIQSVVITQKKDAGSVVTLPGTTGTTSWTLANLPRDPATPASLLLNPGIYEYIITVTDNAGKVSSITRSVTVDTVAPTAQITSVLPMLSGSVVNGKVTLSANASDINGLNGVKYFLRSDASTPAYSDAVAAPLSGVLTAPYSTVIDTTLLTDNLAYEVWLVVQDKAGNDTLVHQTLNISQASDTPTGAIDSPGAGLLIGSDKKIRGTFQDDDGVASGGAVLNLRKVGAPTWTSKAITTTGSAGQLVAWTVDATADLTSDGNYEMYLSVTDDAAAKAGLPVKTFVTPSVGNLGVTAAPQTFLYDVTPPTVSTLSVSPVKTAYKANDVLTFTWTASDASGLASQATDVDGAQTGLGSITNPSGTNYQVIYTVPSSGVTSGNKTLTLITEDVTGRTSSRTLTILVDVDLPVVDSTFSLTPGFIGSTPNGAFTVKGTASDNRGLASVQVNLSGPSGNDGATWNNATLTTGNWSYDITNSATYVAASGTLTINVRATDQAGNVSLTRVMTQSVNQAADKPVVTLISPIASSTYGTTVQISGTAFDDDNLADIDNNTVLDTTGIEIQYWGVSPATGVTTVNPTITGTGQNANFNYSLSGLTDGTYAVKSRAKDDNGTWGDWTSDIGFSVNAGAPNLTVSTVINQFRTNPTLALSGTVADTDGVSYVQVRVNGGAWQDANAGTGSWGAANKSDTWSISVNLGSDGLKTIEVRTADPGAFVNNKQYSTTLDSTAPVAAFDAQFKDDPSGSLLNLTALNKVVRIMGTVTEVNISTVELSIDAGAYSAVTGTSVWTRVWDTTALANGVHSLALRVTDLAGNQTIVNQNVTTNQAADLPVPATNFVPAATAALAGNNVLSTLLKASGTISDDDGFNSGAVSLYLDGSATPIAATNTTGTTGTWEYTWGSLTQGTHYINITSTDKNGQAATIGPVYFLVDTANPTLTVTAPVGGAKIKAGTLTVTGTASDAGGLALTNPLVIGLRHSDVGSNLDGDSFTPAVVGGNFTQNITVDNLSLDGTLYIDLTLTDQAGRVSTITRTVTIDITAPTLNPTYPSPGAYLNGLMSFIGTADDANGLADVTLEVLNPVSKVPVASINRNGTTLASWEFPFNSFAYATTTYAIDVNADGKLWRMYYRLRALDSSGNAKEYLIDDEDADVLVDDYPSIYIDTDGDKPTISVTQPKNGDKIGGFVNMYGTATDDDGPVMQVEVRIDFNGDGDFADTRDIDNSGAIQLGANQNILGNTVKIGDPAHKWEDESAWYVVTASNNSWTLELNGSGELYASNTGGTGDIVIQTRSRDMFGLASEISSRTITLDQTFPQINNALPLDQTYQSGTFNVTAAFGDNIALNLSNLSQIKININKTGFITLPSTSPYLTPNGSNGYDLSYPVNTNTYFPNSSGILYVDLYVKDESNYTNQKSMTYYVDNQKPTGAWSDRVGAPDGLNTKNGMVNINSTNLAYLEGNYGDSGTVSGVDRVEVFFTRGTNVLRLKTASGTLAAPSTESVSVESWNGSAWSTGTETLPYVGHASPGFGNDYVIKIDKPTEMNSSFQGADSDGDGYYEFLGIVGSPRFRAAFNSQFIPDGKVDIHYVVYDLAGNRTHQVRRGFVANNKPEITQIMVGTDLNGNGTLDAGELSKTLAVGLEDTVMYSGVKGRNNRLFFDVTAIQGNGTKRYSMIYNAVERNGTLTSNAATVNTTGYTDSTIVTAGSFAVGSTYTILSVGTTNWAAIGASSATVGTTFVATGAGSGTGTAGLNQTFSFKVYDSTTSDDASETDELADTVTVNLMIFNTDTVAPSVTVAPFGQTYTASDSDAAKALTAVASYDDNILLADLDGDTLVDDRAGHVEYVADSADTTDADVSGQVIFKGKVEDNQRIQRITATIPGFDPDGAGALAAGAEFDIWTFAGGGLTQAGRWTFAVDGTNNLTETYGQVFNWNFTWNSGLITGVTAANRTLTFKVYDFRATPNTATNAITVDVVPYIRELKRFTDYNTIRSRLGAYGIRQGETLTVNGFNLFNTTADVINFPTSGNLALPVGATTTSFTVTVPATASSGNIGLTVNGVAAINNSNNNTRAWNKENDVSKPESVLWTDDRSVHVWRSDNNQTGANRGYFTGSTDPEYPAMSIDTGGVLYGSWSNYATSDVIWAANNGNATTIFSSYDPLEHTDIHFGTRVNIVLNANTYGNGTWDVTGAGGTYVWNAQATNANQYSGTPTGGVYNAEALYHDQKLMQFINQRIVTNGNDIHISYYDTDTKALKYWYRVSNTNSAYAQTWINIDGGSDAHDGTRIVDNGGASRTTAAGEFSAIALTPTNNFPVIAYYDITNQTVKVARANAVNPAAANWTLQTVMAVGDTNYKFSGKYITMKIDSTGYLHLAFFRNSTGDLVYLRSTNNPTNGATAYTFGPSVTVDSIGSVGVWADLAFNGTNPVISYLDSSLVNTFDGIKLAYYDPTLETAAGDTAGIPDTIDGWETMNAAMGYEVESVRTSVETDNATNFWQQAIGYSSSDFFRIGYYVK